MFGAIHSGRTLTKAFHCRDRDVRQVIRHVCWPLASHCDQGGGHNTATATTTIRPKEKELLTHPWPQDIFRHGRLVDARVLVRLEVDERIVRDAFSRGLF